MTGIQAINAVNGWAMALTGITIVLCGLTVLSTIISQLHKLVAWLDRSKEEKAPAEEEASDTQRALALPEQLHEDIDAVAGIYKALADSLGSSFELTKLYAVGAENDLPHVHLSVRALRDAGHLIPEGEGRFTWK